MIFCTEGALHVSIDYNNATGSRHLKLQISIMRDCIEAGEGGMSEQCMITTAERDDVEDQILTSEVVWRAEYDL